MPVKEFLSELVEERSDLSLVCDIVLSCQRIIEPVEFPALSLRYAGLVDRVEGVLLQIYRVKKFALLIDGVVFG